MVVIQRPICLALLNVCNGVSLERLTCCVQQLSGVSAEGFKYAAPAPKTLGALHPSPYIPNPPLNRRRGPNQSAGQIRGPIFRQTSFPVTRISVSGPNQDFQLGPSWVLVWKENSLHQRCYHTIRTNMLKNGSKAAYFFL